MLNTAMRFFRPTIEQGEADIILAFEKLEAARWLSFLKPDGKLVVNDQCIDPMPVITGAAEYPQKHIRGNKSNRSFYDRA